jgi:hypothetical protein
VKKTYNPPEADPECPETEIEEFADKHGLVMKISNLTGKCHCEGKTWTAHFAKCDIHDGHFIIYESGWGNSEESAIRAYAALISGKSIVIDAFLPTRREIHVPKLRCK